MRKDMMKVVAEPARNGSSYRIAKGEKVRLQREGIDSVQREGMGRRWEFDDRSANRDHIQALRRFLRKQVGRPWDKVYSNICHHAPANSFLGHHLRELISYEVNQDVTVRGEELWGRRGWRVYPGDLYVCPETNILKVYDDGKVRKRYRWRPRNEFEMLAIDESHKYVKLDDLWYLVTLSAVPGPEVGERPFDVVLKAPVFAEHFQGDKARPHNNRFVRVWGGCLYASSKSQVGSRDMRRIEAALAEGAKVFALSSRLAASEKRFVRPRSTGRR